MLLPERLGILRVLAVDWIFPIDYLGISTTYRLLKTFSPQMVSFFFFNKDAFLARAGLHQICRVSHAMLWAQNLPQKMLFINLDRVLFSVRGIAFFYVSECIFLQ